MINCTLLNPAIDVNYAVDKIELGKTYTSTPSTVVPAGKGLNVAKVIRELGEKVSLTGLFPENDLKRFSDVTEELKIDFNPYIVEGWSRINTTMVETMNGNITHLNSVSSKFSIGEQEKLKEFMVEKFNRNDTWIFSGSLPNDFDSDLYAFLINEANKNGSTTFLDSRDEPLEYGVRSKPNVVKPNLSELEGFFDEKIEGVHHIALKGKRILDMGINYVFVSLGSDGLIALHENECLLCSTPVMKVLSTVGCGDALVAGLSVAMERNFSFAETCRFAVACGASAAESAEPGKVVRNRVWQIMEEIKIESV